ncbi:MAG: hypothetical protein AAF570_13385, partial [Bacteroidota bacterium]
MKVERAAQVERKSVTPEKNEAGKGSMSMPSRTQYPLGKSEEDAPIQANTGFNGSEPVQMVTIVDLPTLKENIEDRLDRGDPSGTLSQDEDNIDRLTGIYTPGYSSKKARRQDALLKDAKANNFRQEWFGRVNKRIEQGA